MNRSDAERKSAGIPWTGFFQLGAFTALLYLFRVESENLFRVFLAGFVGFAISTFARPAHRHWVLLATSIVGGCVTVGVPATLAISLLAGAIVGVSHLKVKPLFRWLLLFGLLAAFAFGRAFPPAQTLFADRMGLGPLFWPIAGSIFAFRAFMFLYDTTYGIEGVPLPQQLVYFILLPNFALPLFPIVDYRTFIKTYTEEPTRDDFDRGGRMLLAGFAHLIGYRLVYHYMVVDTTGTMRPLARVMYVVSLYLLYLRVSGLFHIVIGVLYFFGYRLPPTHHRHLLSQNFGEFWRQTNSYWKDFNQKYVFSPVAALLQRRLRRGSLQVAVFCSLIGSWAIHSYQYFFLVGHPLFELRDIIFWLLLAVGMVASATLEQRRPTRGRLGPKKAKTTREKVVGSLKTIGFFCMISLLWSFWSAPSWAEWARGVGIGR